MLPNGVKFSSVQFSWLLGGILHQFSSIHMGLPCQKHEKHWSMIFNYTPTCAHTHTYIYIYIYIHTVIPRLMKIICSRITFVSRNMISRRYVLNVNNPVRLVGLPYVMWSAHFFVTHIQMEKMSSWNGLTVHVCCFMLARASTKTFVSQVRKTVKNSSLDEKLISRVTR